MEVWLSYFKQLEQNILAEETKQATEMREFTTLFRVEQSKIDSHCPNIFVLRPRDEQNW